MVDVLASTPLLTMMLVVALGTLVGAIPFGPLRFGPAGAVVFGWVFASHQVGAATAAFGAGWIRDTFGAYDLAWIVAGGLCFLAAVFSVLIVRSTGRREPVEVRQA